jgi:penicillin-binding protein 2
MPANPFELNLSGPSRLRTVNRRTAGYAGDISDPPRLRQESVPVVRIAALLIGLAILGLVARLWFLQVHAGGRYRAFAERNRLQRTVIPALRGTILDRNGVPLAVNEPAFSLTLRPLELPSEPERREPMLARIVEAAGTSRAALDALIAESHEPEVVVAADVPQDLALRAMTSLNDVPAVSVVARASRQYVRSDLASPLGYVGRVTSADLVRHPDLDPTSVLGRSGVEAAVDELLRGSDGYTAEERDSTNRITRTVSTVAPVPGRSVTVTLDADLQAIAANALARGVQRVRAPGGTLIALDPNTGAVLALASAPTYDPNALAHGLTHDAANALFNDPRRPFLNRAIAGEYPSGSTIKPVIAAEALDRGIITPFTTVLSTGGLSVGGSNFPDWKPGGHGVTNVGKALADSVNTFFYYIGGGYGDFRGLGLTGLLDGFERFGLGQPTGIDIPGESNGFLPTAAVRAERGGAWYLGDTYHLSIGQGPFAVTPLQLAVATAAIANGGTLWQPYLLSSETDPNGDVRSIHTPTVRSNRVVGASALATVRSGMRQAVTSGSAQSLADLALPFAGKTGTAQFGDGSKTHAWFTTFGPVNQPQIVVTVLVEAGGEGHAAALPVAKEVLAWWIANRSHP